jgi:FKBP-type peptidyl-prolyl cis-trans isomerase
MKVGGKRHPRDPAEQGLRRPGRRRRHSPNATLLFDVELLEVKS